MPPRLRPACRPPAIEVRRSGVHGRGVYAAGFISKGTRIIEYTGQRVPGKDGGNQARWINHCCEPNCEAIEEEDRIFIHAMRNIEPGEELSYDYALEIDGPITQLIPAWVCQCRGTMLATWIAAVSVSFIFEPRRLRPAVTVQLFNVFDPVIRHVLPSTFSPAAAGESASPNEVEPSISHL